MPFLPHGTSLCEYTRFPQHNSSSDPATESAPNNPPPAGSRGPSGVSVFFLLQHQFRAKKPKSPSRTGRCRLEQVTDPWLRRLRSGVAPVAQHSRARRARGSDTGTPGLLTCSRRLGAAAARAATSTALQPSEAAPPPGGRSVPQPPPPSPRGSRKWRVRGSPGPAAERPASLRQRRVLGPGASRSPLLPLLPLLHAPPAPPRCSAPSSSSRARLGGPAASRLLPPPLLFPSSCCRCCF